MGSSHQSIDQVSWQQNEEAHSFFLLQTPTSVQVFGRADPVDQGSDRTHPLDENC